MHINLKLNSSRRSTFSLVFFRLGERAEQSRAILRNFFFDFCQYAIEEKLRPLYLLRIYLYIRIIEYKFLQKNSIKSHRHFWQQRPVRCDNAKHSAHRLHNARTKALAKTFQFSMCKLWTFIRNFPRLGHRHTQRERKPIEENNLGLPSIQCARPVPFDFITEMNIWCI